LINYYADGRSKMGFHSDEIDNLEDGTEIIIISLGTERKLSFRAKADYTERRSYQLPPGSLMYMSQRTQEFWSHAIKRANVTDGRISLTFRRMIPQPNYSPVIDKPSTQTSGQRPPAVNSATGST
jgi:alkylated DNA repair dioxygenase AlkB